MNGNEEKPPKILDSRKVEEKARSYVDDVMTKTAVDTTDPVIVIIGVMIEAAFIIGYRQCEEDRENGGG